MSNRAPLLLALIAIISVVVLYCNLDLVRPAFQYSSAVTRLLTWQGSDVALRSLRLREGLDLQGGLQVLLKANMEGHPSTDLDRAAATIKERVDALGVTEPLVQTQGTDKIVVELPGVKDKDLALKTIGETALLEFVYSGETRLEPGAAVSTTWDLSQTLFAELPAQDQSPFLETIQVGGAVTTTSPITSTSAITAVTPITVSTILTATNPVTAAAGLTATEGVTATAPLTATPGVTSTASAPLPPGEEQVTVYPTVITGEYLQSAAISVDQVTTEIVVSFVLNAEGGKRMKDFTAQHNSPESSSTVYVMPILLDGKVISSPAVRAEISNQGQISGRFTRDEANVLVAQLNSGSLPVDLTVVGQTGIGPTLGRESLDDAVKGGLVGFLVVLAFMLVYYRLPGALADLALALYALMVLTLFRLLPVTLTLAGIAGFVLSLGMAVDANILIFERMKEELRSGRRLAAAMEIGFQRAWPSIRDSNMSTLITCVILFWFGSQFGASIVKGFAVTLFVGVVTSLFTAIIVTRNFLWLANRTLAASQTDRTTPAENRRLRFLFGF